MTELSPAAVRKGFERARERRQPWEPLWRECYAYALPQRGIGLGSEFAPARRYSDGLFDGTAPDAVEQLAASLLAELTPPWSQWFGFRPGHDVGPEERVALGGYLEDIAERVRGHFERSTFAVEIHQCFLDLVTVGTATLLFQEAPVGEPSAFRFCAVPAAEMFIDGDQNGADSPALPGHQPDPGGDPLALPEAPLPASVAEDGEADPEHRFDVLEAVIQQASGYAYTALLRQPSAKVARTSSCPRARSSSRPSLHSAGSRAQANSTAAHP